MSSANLQDEPDVGYGTGVLLQERPGVWLRGLGGWTQSGINEALLYIFNGRTVSVIAMHVAAVIVTYNNTTMLKELLGDLFRQSRRPDNIIVVDNSDHDDTEQVMKKDFGQVQYVRQAENIGSGGGYYEAIRIATVDNDYIYTLDDDVRLDENSLSEIIKGSHELEKSMKIGAVRSVANIERNKGPWKLEIFPWRGTLLKTEAIKLLGLPRKDYFIYGEDLEYSLRFKKNGFFCYWIPSSQCYEHRTSGKTIGRLMGKTIRTYSYPYQFYYAFRNEISIYKEYGLFAKLMKSLLYAMGIILFISIRDQSHKSNNIKAIRDGLMDGLRERLGKNPNYLP
jgi:rhamnopyranosyl-N-acetylglucosaminyl-diphospho-decaprenol beta-1,3/1,4-galactofuranosyltransferase